MTDTRQEHWDKIFATKDEEAVSWFQVRPETSLRLIHACGLPKDARILDVGAGCSHLPDALVVEGFTNIAVLDIGRGILSAGAASWTGGSNGTPEPSPRVARSCGCIHTGPGGASRRPRF